MADPDEFLTFDEIAKQLKVNPQSIRNWIDAGQLRHTRVGTRRVRVRRSDLNEFLAAGTPDTSEPPEPPPPPLPAMMEPEQRAALIKAFRALSDAAAQVADALGE